MGLFLGYAILNFPTMLLILYGYIKKSCLDSNPSKVQSSSRSIRNGDFDQHLLLMLGTTTFMMNTVDGNKAKSDEEDEMKDDNKYYNAIKNLEERLKKIEQQLQ